MARLRNTASPPDSGDLYQRTVRQIRVFEQEARDKGVPLEQLRPAHYALCASLDDIVLNTPWGSSGTWSQRSLVSTFHQEVRSGERFFDVLKQMSANPGKFLPVIELMYICMSLGFIGQYRLSRRGVGEINRIREETYAVIVRHKKPAEPALAPHTKGVNGPTGRRASSCRSGSPPRPGWASSARSSSGSRSASTRNPTPSTPACRARRRTACRRSPARRSSSPRP
jgi:type VI secretion system protein ImpK